MEDVLHQIVEEETDELRLQLEQKENTILEIKQSSEQEKHPFQIYNIIYYRIIYHIWLPL